MLDLNGLLQYANQAGGIGAMYQGQNQAQALDTGAANIQNVLSQIRDRMARLGMAEKLLPGEINIQKAHTQQLGAQSQLIGEQATSEKELRSSRVKIGEAEAGAKEYGLKQTKFINAQDELAAQANQLAAMTDPQARQDMIQSIYQKHGVNTDVSGVGPTASFWGRDPQKMAQDWLTMNKDTQREIAGRMISGEYQVKAEGMRGERALSIAQMQHEAAMQRVFGSNPLAKVMYYGQLSKQAEQQGDTVSAKQYLEIAQSAWNAHTANMDLKTKLAIAQSLGLPAAFGAVPQGANAMPQVTQPTPSPVGGGSQTNDIKAAVERAGGVYEPDKYDYRITPDGKVQRKPKGK